MSLGELRQILKALADILVSGASHSALNGLEVFQSATIVHIDDHRKF